MFAEYSMAETAQRLTCLADSCVNFSVQRAITRYGAPQIFEMFYVGKWFVVSGDGGGGVVIVWCRLVEHLRLSETDCQAEELGCLREAVQHLRWPLVRSRRQREPLGGEFAGFSSLL